MFERDERLLNLLRYVRQKVPYYKNPLVDCELDNTQDAIICLENLPSIDKATILKIGHGLISDDVSTDDLIWEHTSGTTGIPLKIGKTHEERTRYAFRLMKWRRDHFNIQLSDQYAYFTTIADDLKYIHDRNTLFLSEINLDDASFEVYYQQMNEKKVTWMFSTPSVTYVLMNYMKRQGKPPISSLRYIELTGEQITIEEKKKFSDFFCCQIAEQYGIKETWAIAKECREGNLHVLEDDILLDLSHKDKLLVTALGQFGMPFIKYEVEDTLRYGKECTCGCAYRTIEIIKSRSLEFLSIGKDIRISPILLRICITRLIRDYSIEIEQFQFVQNSFDEVVCYIKYLNNRFSDNEIRSLLMGYVNGLYSLPAFFNIQVKRSDSLIDKFKRGKLGYFVSML